jgi:hypothetical protein
MSHDFWSTKHARRLVEIEGLSLTPAMVMKLRQAYKECPDTPLINGVHCRRFEWHGRVHDRSYVRQRIASRGGPQSLHRVMEELRSQMRLAPDTEVHHVCGHAWCGEPLHLQALPIHEHRELERRRHSGEGNPRARHTDAQVAEAIALVEQGIPIAEVAAQLKASPKAVRDWVSGRTRNCSAGH